MQEAKLSTVVQLILRCGWFRSQIWQTVSGEAAQLATEIRAKKTGNQLQGWGGSHMRKVKTAVRLHKIPERSQGARDLFLRLLSLRLLSSHPPPFAGGSSPNDAAPCTRTSDRREEARSSYSSFLHRGHAGTMPGLDPNLPQPRLVFSL